MWAGNVSSMIALVASSVEFLMAKRIGHAMKRKQSRIIRKEDTMTASSEETKEDDKPLDIDKLYIDIGGEG